MFGIDDAIIGSVGGSLLGGLFGGDSGGGTQTVNNEPWKEAQPWILDNIKRGQDLQSYYTQNPFGAIQQAAYRGLLGGNDYINSALPSLLNQFSQQVGFDRSNPTARPAPIQFPSAQGLLSASGLGGGGGTAGLLGGDMNVTMNPFRNGGIPAPAPAPAVAAPPGRPANDNAGAYFQLPNGNWTLGYDRETYGAT
jgi:hypothetical protein